MASEAARGANSRGLRARAMAAQIALTAGVGLVMVGVGAVAGRKA